jgi:hypothetical protein
MYNEPLTWIYLPTTSKMSQWYAWLKFISFDYSLKANDAYWFKTWQQFLYDLIFII